MWAGLAVVVVILACATRKTQPIEIDWVYAAIRPPVVKQDGTSVNLYRKWWGEAEDCLGLRLRFERVTWWVIRTREDGIFRVGPIDSLVGFTLGRPDGKAVIMLSQKYWLTPRVIRHESVHAITGKPHGELPEELFDRCSEGEP